MKLVLASKNAHKLVEMRDILSQLGVEVVLESEVGVVGLLHQVVPDAVLAHVQDGVNAVGQTPELGPLLACQFFHRPVSF